MTGGKRGKPNPVSKTVLSRRTGLIILGALLLLDTIFDVLRGTQGNPLFKPIENTFGIWVFPLLVPFALVFFYAVAKALGWIVEKVDRTPYSEGIILTALVLIFALHDIWVFSVDYLGFRLIRSYYQMIPIYIVVGMAYALWAQYTVKNKVK